MTRQELREPDKVEKVLSGWWVHLEQYWKLMVAGCLGIMIAGAGSSLYSQTAVTQDADLADAFGTALYPLTAPVGEEDPNAPDYAKAFERFSDVAAAKTAGVERMQTFLDAHGDADMGRLTRVLQASLATGGADSMGTLEAAANDESMTAFQPTALMALGRAQIAAGESDKAAATYQRLADSTQGATRALALMTLGDMVNPLISSSGDAGQARTHYTEAQKALGPKPSVDADDVFASFSEPYLYSELDNKLALLD